jgi:hypothetical protein
MLPVHTNYANIENECPGKVLGKFWELKQCKMGKRHGFGATD